MNQDMPALAAGSCYESRVTRALCSGPKSPLQIAEVTGIDVIYIPSIVSRARRLLAVPGWQIKNDKGVYSISRV